MYTLFQTLWGVVISATLNRTHSVRDFVKPPMVFAMHCSQKHVTAKMAPRPKWQNLYPMTDSVENDTFWGYMAFIWEYPLPPPTSNHPPPPPTPPWALFPHPFFRPDKIAIPGKHSLQPSWRWKQKSNPLSFWSGKNVLPGAISCRSLQAGKVSSSLPAGRIAIFFQQLIDCSCQVTIESLLANMRDSITFGSIMAFQSRQKRNINCLRIGCAFPQSVTCTLIRVRNLTSTWPRSEV